MEGKLALVHHGLLTTGKETAIAIIGSLPQLPKLSAGGNCED